MIAIQTSWRFVVVALTFSIGLCFCGELSAQLFSGAGIKDKVQKPELKTDAATTNPIKSIFSRDKTDMGERKPLTLPRLGLFKNSAPKFGLDSNDSMRPRLFDGMPKLFPEGIERPNFLSDLNERTKSLFPKPTFSLSDWAMRTNENAKAKTFETWDAITRGFKNPLNRSSSTSPPPAQPPVRAAQRTTDAPSVRF